MPYRDDNTPDREIANNNPKGRITQGEFRQGMRALAAAVSVVTTQHNGERAGLAATSVCSLTAEPPRLLLAVNRKASAYPVLNKSRVVAVNVLDQTQISIAQKFAGLDGSDRSMRFAEGKWGTLVTGAPVLEDSIASFDCRIAEMHHAATHDILVCDIVAIEVRALNAPLVYIDQTFVTTQLIDKLMNR